MALKPYCGECGSRDHWPGDCPLMMEQGKAALLGECGEACPNLADAEKWREMRRRNRERMKRVRSK